MCHKMGMERNYGGWKLKIGKTEKPGDITKLANSRQARRFSQCAVGVHSTGRQTGI